MQHLHDEFDDADMKFLEKFAEIEADKKEVDEADAEGIKQAQDSDWAGGDGGIEMSGEGLDDFHGDDHIPGMDGDGGAEEGIDGLSGEGGGEGEGQQEGQGEAEGTGEGEDNGEQGDGKDGKKGKDKKGDSKLSEDGEGEPSDDAEDGDGDGDAEGEGDDGEQDGDDGDESGEGEEGKDGESGSDESDEGEDEGKEGEDERQGEGEGENKPECEGDCEENEGDEDSEPCPYCQEKEKRQEQGKNSDPIALDSNGDPIYVGSEIRSKADGRRIPEDAVEWVGVVMGLAYGLNEEGSELNQRMIVAYRRDHITGLYYVEGEKDNTGWGVRSDLTTVIGEKKEQQEKQEQQQDSDVLFIDADGQEIREGDELYVFDGNNTCGFPVEGIVRADKECRNVSYKRGLLLASGLTPLNFEHARLKSWLAWDDKLSYTFSKDSPTLEGMRKHVHKEDEQEKDELKEEDYKIPDNDNKPMTQQQKSRFENLCERIFKKSEQSFGSTIEKDDIGPNMPGGIFDGEEIAKCYTVESRGVRYTITVSAERYE